MQYFALFKHIGVYDLKNNLYFASHRKVLKTLKLKIDDISDFLGCMLL